MKTDKIKLSIITATYNSDKTVTETFNSVLSQTYEDLFEYIVIDGNSKDNTVNIIKEYEPLFIKRNIVFKWISEPDKGIYDAWNKALKISTGNWLAFIGSDDKYYINALEVYNKYITKNPEIDYFHSLIKVCDNNKTYLRTLKSKFNEEGIPITVAHVGTFHSVRLFNDNKHYSLKYKIASDYELLLRKGYLKHLHIPEVLVEMDDGGVSGSFKTKIECLNIMRKSNVFPKKLAYSFFIYSVLQFYAYKIISKIFGRKFVPSIRKIFRF